MRQQKRNIKIQQILMAALTVGVFAFAACSNSTNDNNTEKGTMPYNSNSETFQPDSAGSTTAYNNSTTGTTYSTTGGTTNGRTNDGMDDSLKNKPTNHR